MNYVNNTSHCSGLKCGKASCNASFYVGGYTAKCTAVSGDDGRHEFHTDKGYPGHSCISLLTTLGVL